MTETFQIKNSDIFHTFAQNIDCGNSLEPHRHNLCIKVGLNGVELIYRHVFVVNVSGRSL